MEKFDVKLPESFVSVTENIFKTDYCDFRKSLNDPVPISIRSHPLKGIRPTGVLDQVPWCKQGYYLQERPYFTTDPGFHAGAYYVQEASSMFLSHILNQIDRTKQFGTILDACAAPGGKSTLLLSHLNGKGILVANETIRKRSYILKENLIKWGYSNYILTSNDVASFNKNKHQFDLVLVDAPCSGEGLFRKNAKAMEFWSTAHVEHCAMRQRRILSEACKLVKPGGFIIYCTCTYNSRENDDNVTWMMKESGMKSIRIRIEKHWNIVEEPQNFFAYRLLPHKVRGEGFFISVLKKEAGENFERNDKVKFKIDKKNQIKAFGNISCWVRDQNIQSYYQRKDGIISYLPVGHPVFGDKMITKICAGTKVGRVVKNSFIPSHELVQSFNLHQNLPFIDLDEREAISFLSGNTLTNKSGSMGWMMVKHKNFCLGLAKALKGRLNNHYPKNLRIKRIQ